MSLPERELVSHLLRRFGLGASEAEVDYYVEGGYQSAVEKLLDIEGTEETFPVRLQDLKSGKTPRVAMPAVVLWWTARLLTTRRPLQEKMTLFWHDHFATSASKVGAPLVMAQQNETLRANALGSFQTLLREASKDPAMLLWLDNQQNVKGKPNENFAREVLELFTLGIGHYSEEDVKEAARAFTGWSFRRTRNDERGGAVGEFLLRTGQHDSGTKRVLGLEGALDGDQVLQHLCELPRTSEYIVEKLLKWFVHPSPEPATVRRFASIFRDRDLQIKPLVRTIMLSDEFTSTKSVRAIVKNPVDFVIPTMRQLGIGAAIVRNYKPESARRTLAPAATAAQAMRSMGMWLLYPPDVAGWESGQAWITSATMVERYKWSDKLLRGYPINQVVPERTPESLVDRLLSILDANDLQSKRKGMIEAAAKAADQAPAASVATVCRLIFASPEFQMG